VREYPQDLTADERALAQAMSDVSEGCFYAGWLGELEYSLWDLATNGAAAASLNPAASKFAWGHCGADELEALLATAIDLAQQCKRWIVWDGDMATDALTKVRAVDLDDWLVMFAAWEQRTD